MSKPATGLYIRCPEDNCTRGDGKPRHLVRLAQKHEGRTWIPFEDPVDGVRVYACPVHGRYEVTPDNVPHKPRRRT